MRLIFFNTEKYNKKYLTTINSNIENIDSIYTFTIDNKYYVYLSKTKINFNDTSVETFCRYMNDGEFFINTLYNSKKYTYKNKIFLADDFKNRYDYFYSFFNCIETPNNVLELIDVITDYRNSFDTDELLLPAVSVLRERVKNCDDLISSYSSDILRIRSYSNEPYTYLKAYSYLKIKFMKLDMIYQNVNFKEEFDEVNNKYIWTCDTISLVPDDLYKLFVIAYLSVTENKPSVELHIKEQISSSSPILHDDSLSQIPFICDCETQQIYTNVLSSIPLLVSSIDRPECLLYIVEKSKYFINRDIDCYFIKRMLESVYENSASVKSLYNSYNEFAYTYITKYSSKSFDSLLNLFKPDELNIDMLTKIMRNFKPETIYKSRYYSCVKTSNFNKLANFIFTNKEYILKCVSHDNGLANSDLSDNEKLLFLASCTPFLRLDLFSDKYLPEFAHIIEGKDKTYDGRITPPSSFSSLISAVHTQKLKNIIIRFSILYSMIYYMDKMVEPYVIDAYEEIYTYLFNSIYKSTEWYKKKLIRSIKDILASYNSYLDINDNGYNMFKMIINAVNKSYISDKDAQAALNICNIIHLFGCPVKFELEILGKIENNRVFFNNDVSQLVLQGYLEQ